MKEKVFYFVNEIETESQGGRDPLEHALPEVLSVFASPE